MDSIPMAGTFISWIRMNVDFYKDNVWTDHTNFSNTYLFFISDLDELSKWFRPNHKQNIGLGKVGIMQTSRTSAARWYFWFIHRNLTDLQWWIFIFNFSSCLNFCLLNTEWWLNQYYFTQRKHRISQNIRKSATFVILSYKKFQNIICIIWKRLLKKN